MKHGEQKFFSLSGLHAKEIIELSSKYFYEFKNAFEKTLKRLEFRSNQFFFVLYFNICLISVIHTHKHIYHKPLQITKKN